MYKQKDAFSRVEVVNNAVFLKNILDSFILGLGYTLPAKFYLNNDCTDVNKALFREAIVKQVTLLIGRKPRLLGEGDGEFDIYYE